MPLGRGFAEKKMYTYYKYTLTKIKNQDLNISRFQIQFKDDIRYNIIPKYNIYVVRLNLS